MSETTGADAWTRTWTITFDAENFFGINLRRTARVAVCTAALMSGMHVVAWWLS